MMNNPHDRNVPCPYCGAKARERCVDNQGDRVEWNHAVRITSAGEQVRATTVDDAITAVCVMLRERGADDLANEVATGEWRTHLRTSVTGTAIRAGMTREQATEELRRTTPTTQSEEKNGSR